jgi:hypothetical protein
VTRRKQSDPSYAAYVRKALQAEMSQEIDGAVTPAGQPTTKVRVSQELTDFARKYNKEPIANLRPKGGFVTLDGEQKSAEQGYGRRSTGMSNIAHDLTMKAKEVFMQETKDLSALTKNGPNDVFKRVAAALALDSEAQSDCLLYATILDQKNECARDQARDDFRNSMLVAICKSYLRIQRNGVIQYVSKLTPEAQEQLEFVEIMAG